MTSIVFLKEFFLCVASALFFAVLFRAPRATLPVSAAIAGLGWVVFRLMGGSLPAYFVATLMMALLGEIAARVWKRPATLYIHPAVIPLVPGGGLYQTMLYLVEGDTQLGLAEGSRTLLAIGMMALAIGVASLIFRYMAIGRKRRAV